MLTANDGTVTATLTLAPGADVLGYVSQCELCGQRAITLAAHGTNWLCPRCAEVAEPSPYAAAETDHYPIEKVRG